MRKQLVSELKKMGDTGFFQIKMRVEVAMILRSAIRKYCLDDKYLLEKLKTTRIKLSAMKIAAHDFSLRDISNIQAMEHHLAVNAAEIEVKEKVSFPRYRDSAPAYIPHGAVSYCVHANEVVLIDTIREGENEWSVGDVVINPSSGEATVIVEIKWQEGIQNGEKGYWSIKGALDPVFYAASKYKKRNGSK